MGGGQSRRGRTKRMCDEFIESGRRVAHYANLLTCVQPPRVEVGWKRIAPRIY